MQFFVSLLTNLPYINSMPLAGWLVWAGLAGLLGVSLYNWRSYQSKMDASAWGTVGVLFVSMVIGSLFFGIEVPAAPALPIPGFPESPPGSTILVFSAIPWMMAGGLLGPFSAAALGIFSGIVRGVWDTHNLFTILDLGLMGALFSTFVRQRYRTPFYRLARQPLIGALGLVFVHALIFIFSSFFTYSSFASVTERLDYAISNAGAVSLTFGVEVLIGGFLAQVLALASPARWGGSGSLEPSPAERSIETRFVSGTGTIISVLLVTLLAGDWIIAGRAARGLLEERLKSVAQVGEQSVPFFFEAGQNLAGQIAGDVQGRSESDLSNLLGEQMRSVPYFNQLIVYDLQSATVIASYPDGVSIELSPDEESGTLLALDGVPNQVYSIPPALPGGAAQISFIALVPNEAKVLIARTDLQFNPYMRSLINSLNSLQQVGGAGMLIDEQGLVLYHPQPELVMTQYPGGILNTAPGFVQETSSNGTRQLVYRQPVPGQPWYIVLTVPAQEAQQIAIQIALPISIMIILLGLFALFSLRLSLRTVTGSLHGLASEAKHIASGKLDRPLPTDGADEVGDLRRAFEQMRISLQGRLDELNRLLAASQGVASTLDLEDALNAVLKAVVESGASSARIVLAPEKKPGQMDIPALYTNGPEKNSYGHLDQQILALAERQDRIVMATVSGTRGMVLDAGKPQPASLSAVALRHEQNYFGVLWVGYKNQRIFTEADIRFLSTLASQAALAVANIRLFVAVESSRRQLQTILNSTPDPVLVTDASNQLVMANPAASELFGVTLRGGEQKDIGLTSQIKPLYDLLQATAEDGRTNEINMPNGKTYLATASSMTADGKTVGRVCIMRDVTQLKEIDTLKSEFVNTVSHDLRSPLTLMRGYASMLEMVGELNDQQKKYAGMIVQGVDNMSGLVNNLLDLGRIEFGVGLQLEDVPAIDIVDKVINNVQMHARHKNINLGVETPKDVQITVQVDPALIHQAIYNLVENAIKYTPDGGTVTLSVVPAADTLTFAIKDTGIGIPQDNLARLFEKFYRGTNRDALAQRGTGLGLAIVKSIAERHGGKVWVESELKKGSTFFLLIPLKQKK